MLLVLQVEKFKPKYIVMVFWLHLRSIGVALLFNTTTCGIQYTSLTQGNCLKEDAVCLARDTSVHSWASVKWNTCQIQSQCAGHTWYR